MLNFSKVEYKTRFDRLLESMSNLEIDLAIIHSPENICYLTGHETPGYYTYQALIVPIKEKPILLMRVTETANARIYSNSDMFTFVGYNDMSDPLEETAEVAAKYLHLDSVVGIEENGWFFSPKSHAQLLKRLSLKNPIVSLDEIINNLRLVKSPAEIVVIRETARITNMAMRDTISSFRPEQRERDLAATAFHSLIINGSDYLSMEPFVASGPRSGIIHSSWTSRSVAPREPVLLEMSATVARYNAPLMHTIWSESLSSPLMEMSEACLMARSEMLKEVKPGGSPANAHQVCKSVIADLGLAHTYRKRSGYSVGIGFSPDWGEGHILSLKETEEKLFEVGMVIHVVPTLRLEGVGGIGYSATVLVTNSGYEILTSADQTGPS